MFGYRCKYNNTPPNSQIFFEFGGVLGNTLPNSRFFDEFGGVSGGMELYCGAEAAVLLALLVDVKRVVTV